MSQAANLPADEVIHAEIRDILSTSDLMTVTKKSVKAELERRYVAKYKGTRYTANGRSRFGCDLTLKKQFIGQAVESLLVNGIH
jgi:chitin synthase